MDISLVHYIEYCTKKGIPKETIKQSLIKAGWKEVIVDQALSTASTVPSQVKPKGSRNMWTGPIVLALVLLALTNIYNFFYFGAITTKSTVEAIAGAAAFLIGISFSLSSMSYYFNFLDTKLAYRKEIGLIGYYLAVVYATLLIVTNPERYLSGFLKNLMSADFILGLLALLILSAMALVSINKVMMKITPAVGKKILHLGYFAYSLLIIRAIVIERETWLLWFESFNKIPPARLLVTLFASFIIILRLTMATSIFIRNRKKTTLQPQNTPQFKKI